jgi:hypothetical protein
MGVKEPGGLNSRVVPTASATAKPNKQPRMRSIGVMLTILMRKAKKVNGSLMIFSLMAITDGYDGTVG